MSAVSIDGGKSRVGEGLHGIGLHSAGIFAITQRTITFAGSTQAVNGKLYRPGNLMPLGFRSHRCASKGPSSQTRVSKATRLLVHRDCRQGAEAVILFNLSRAGLTAAGRDSAYHRRPIGKAP